MLRQVLSRWFELGARVLPYCSHDKVQHKLSQPKGLDEGTMPGGASLVRAFSSPARRCARGRRRLRHSV